MAERTPDRPSLLIVDDEEIVRESLGGWFQDEGYEVGTCGSAREGLIRIQDEASQLIAPLVGPLPGERILDLCAGAGGKTLHLAALMKNQGRITAVDLRPDRLRGLGREAERLGVSIVETRTGDAAAPSLGSGETFDDCRFTVGPMVIYPEPEA